TTTGSAAEALELCDQEHQFDIILSDIEMPEMSGIEFAEELRRQDKWQNIPLVALSSHTSQHDVNKGIQAGFHSYIAKFDRDSLLDTLSETFSEARKDYGEAL
ncbi:MAG: response regulator, partial [Pseudomonadota bacterium]|nr:response regulator [Pseudomonadota bacterium]